MNCYKAILVGNGTMGERHRARFESSGVIFEKILDQGAEQWLEGQFDQWAKRGDGSAAKVLNNGNETCLDFAVVASPASSHYEYAKFFLERKIPVLVEKPLATSSEQAVELVNLSKKNGTLLFVAQSECYNPLFLNFRKHLLVDLRNANAASRALAGSGGFAPLNVKLEFRREHGFNERCRDVDVHLDLLVHDISLFLNLFDAKDVAVVDGGHSCGCGSRAGGRENCGCSDQAEMTLKVVSGEFAGVEADFYVNRNSSRDLRTISVEFGRNGNMSGFDYSVSLVRYTSEGAVAHIPDSLDNEHRFFLKLLAGECSDWAERALLNAAQSVSLVSEKSFSRFL